jgi:copper(I)-binding protein
MLPFRLAAASIAVAALAGCKPAASPPPIRSGTIEVSDGWSRETSPGQNTGGGFFTVTNGSGVADRLLAAQSPAAEKVEVHRMTMDGGVMRMRAVADGVAIASGQRMTFGPGSYHLMMIGLKAPLKQGQSVPLTLKFQRAGEVAAVLKVQSVAAAGPNG